jgi:Right handed beta helix region
MFYRHAIAILTVIVFIVVTNEAHAVQRTHVSAAFGADSNTATGCTAVAPCRFFQAAMTVTDTNGEVVVLDSGGYGAVTITKSLALIAPTGVYAGISVFPGANGVTIATAGVNVVLRGLTINGQGGNKGISMTAGNSLTVENCVIANMIYYGINVSGITTVNVTDSIVRRNPYAGINLENGVKATITRTVVNGNGRGIVVTGPGESVTNIADSTIDGSVAEGVLAYLNGDRIIRVSVHNSRVVGNDGDGLRAQGVGSQSAFLLVLHASNNFVANNGGNGIVAANFGAAAFVSGNTLISNKGSGLFNNNSAGLESARNNVFQENGSRSQGTIRYTIAE